MRQGVTPNKEMLVDTGLKEDVSLKGETKPLFFVITFFAEDKKSSAKIKIENILHERRKLCNSQHPSAPFQGTFSLK